MLSVTLLAPSCGSRNTAQYVLLSYSCYSIYMLIFVCQRNRVPWAIIVACEVAFAGLFIIIRILLALENSRRDRENPDETFDEAFVTVKDESGVEVQKKVDKAFLDLTDRQNRDFRYVL